MLGSPYSSLLPAHELPCFAFENGLLENERAGAA